MFRNDINIVFIVNQDPRPLPGRYLNPQYKSVRTTAAKPRHGTLTFTIEGVTLADLSSVTLAVGAPIPGRGTVAAPHPVPGATTAP